MRQEPQSLGLAFGVVLREARMEAGVSQEALAARAGLHRTYVSLLERGKRGPTLEVVDRLARSLGTKAHAMVESAEARRKLG